MENQQKETITLFNRELPLSDFWQTPSTIYYYVNSFYHQAGLNEEYFDPCPKNPKEDGLLIDWPGNIYINPPYSRGQLGLWVKKGIKEYEAGRALNQVWVLNYSNSKTLQLLKEAASAVCDLHARIRFIKPTLLNAELDEDYKDRPRYNNVIYYLGAHKQQFQEVFKTLGKVFVA